MTVKTNELSAELFLRLYISVGWEPPGIGQVQKALDDTIATFTAFDGETAVGIVRLISSKEAVGFYQRHGLEDRPCGWDGPGMFKMIR